MKLNLDKIERMMIRKGLRRTDVFGLSSKGLVASGVFTNIKQGLGVQNLTAFKLCNLLGCDIDEIALDVEEKK